MDSLEKTTKSILKSLTLSSAKGITVQNLCRDYRDIVGTAIPFQKLGYSDLMGFLKSIPDTIFISGSGMSALVIPVTDEKTAHLEDMIQKQKKPSSRSKKRCNSSRIIQRPRAIRIDTNKSEYTRRDYGAANILPTEEIGEKFNNWDDFSSDESQGINHAMPTNNESHSTSFSKPNILPTKEIEEKFHNMNDISSDESHSIINHMQPTKSDFHPTSTILNETKSRVRATNNSYNDFAASTISRKFNDPFKDKLRELISKYPNGLWCCELPQYYKKHFNANLNVAEKGYCSVIHFCTSHSDIFHCIKPDNGDWKIFDAQRPIPYFENDNNHSAAEETSMVRNKDNALPELDLTDVLRFSNQNIEVMPSDILQFGEKIPRQWLQIPDDGYITVRVTEVYDPSKFWIQLYSEDCSVALDHMMNDMQDFYVLNEAYNIPTSDVQVGLYCVALIYNEWHRGMVVKIEDPYVKIFYFDYGSIAKTFRHSLKYLHKKFSMLPRQAIRARLANIRPRYPAVMWSSKATKLLLSLINDRVLVAEVLNSVEIEYHTLHVILTDTNDPNKDVHINDELKKQGLAELMAEVCKVNTYYRNRPIKNAHYFLYPNHQDIETGIVPTIDEVAIMTANGISVDMIFKPYINSVENNKEYSFNFKEAPTKSKPYQMDFYVSKNKDVTENEEVDSCLEIDEVLPETEYDSDGCSSIASIGTVQDESLRPKTPNLETQINETKNIDIPKPRPTISTTTNVKPPIEEQPKPIDELTCTKVINDTLMRVEEVIDTSLPDRSENSLNIKTHFEHDGSAINVSIRPPPGFQLSKPIIPPPIDPSTIQNPYYNPYQQFTASLSPSHAAQLMHSMMLSYGAGAVAAQSYMSSQAQLYQNMYQNPYYFSIPTPTSPQVIPGFLPMSTSNVNNTFPKNQSFNNASNNTLPVNLLNSITQQTDNLSLQNNKKTSINVQTIVEDLKDNLKTLLKIKENNNTEEIRLLEAQINEIIRSIVTDNVITSLVENLIKLIKLQISKLTLKETQNLISLDAKQQNRKQLTDASAIKDNEVCCQERNISKQINQSTEIRQKLTDASIQVDINYEINKLNNETTETAKNNCDVEKIKKIECEKIKNVRRMSKENKHIVNNRNDDRIELSDTDVDTACNDRDKNWSEKLIDELNISKDKSISNDDNLCKKIEPKASVELKEFAQKKIYVIKINGEYYFSTIEFLLTYTRFPTIDSVKSLFSSYNIDFPSIEINIETHSKHSYKKLLKHNVPGCFPGSPLIQLVKCKDVPVLIEKLFAANPALR
ncbi:uncharacterized protein LOC123292629 [Chrysoperla carnea]|uniref:uncharacterized protein LOC123292629 n=1 Tax=Chrysoperla carnea TaxID=189513 RepID=UPI001D07C25C|nr:uncharacterized protein LOC123292629 [Chrysoperla carnea]